MLGRWPRRRDERGAVAAIVGVSTVLLVLIAAFVVDLGVQRVLRRDLQAMVDVVALDMARNLDGRTQAVIKATPAWRGQLGSSVLRNINENPAPGVTVQQKQQDAVATVDDGETVVTATMGLLDDDGEFSEIPYPEVPTAVRVTARSSVDFAFSGVVGISEGGASRSGVATADGGACFSLGSYAAGIESGESSLLGPLLGDSLGITAAGYEGLLDIDATVPILDLGLELGAVTAEGIADTEVTMKEFYLAIAEVLRGRGDTANAELLEGAAGLSLGPLDPIRIGDLIQLEPGADAALNGEVDVLDLVTGAAILSDGRNAVRLEDLGVTIPILNAGFTSNLTLIEKPQTACGRKGTTKETSQVELILNGTLANLSTSSFPLIGGLLGALADVKISATPVLRVEGATGRGVLTDIRCEPGSPVDGITVDVTGSLAETELVVPIVITARLGILANVRIGMIVRVINPGSTLNREVKLDFPPKLYDTPYSAGSGGLGLAGATTSIDPNPAVHSRKYITTQVLGLDLFGLVGALVNTIVGNVNPIANAVVTPLVSALDDLVLGPLGDLAGLTVAGVDVIGHRKPTCSLPKLVG